MHKLFPSLTFFAPQPHQSKFASHLASSVGQLPHGRSMIQFHDDDVDDDQAVSFVEDDDSGSMEVGKGYGMGSNLCIGGLGRGGYGGVGWVSSDTAVDVGRRRCGRPLQDVTCRCGILGHGGGRGTQAIRPAGSGWHSGTNGPTGRGGFDGGSESGYGGGIGGLGYGSSRRSGGRRRRSGGSGTGGSISAPWLGSQGLAGIWIFRHWRFGVGLWWRHRRLGLGRLPWGSGGSQGAIGGLGTGGT